MVVGLHQNEGVEGVEGKARDAQVSGASGGVHLVAYADDLQNVSLEPRPSACSEQKKWHCSAKLGQKSSGLCTPRAGEAKFVPEEPAALRSALGLLLAAEGRLRRAAVAALVLVCAATSPAADAPHDVKGRALQEGHKGVALTPMPAASSGVPVRPTQEAWAPGRLMLDG
eukprot:s1226_g26.t1